MKFLFQISIALPPMLLAVFFPTSDLPHGLGQFVNLFWGTLYGAGWFLSGFLMPLRAAMPFGLLLWPIILTIGLYVIGGRVWSSDRKKPLVICYIISLAVTVPFETYKQHFGFIPVYYELMSIAY